MMGTEGGPPSEPEWAGPPENVIPGAIPLELLLAASARAAVALRGRAAYPNGFEFDLVARCRAAIAGELPSPSPFLLAGEHEFVHGRLSPRFLRFGLEFPDGRKVTNLPRSAPGTGADPGAGPILSGRDGSASNFAWQQTYWVWPLPPPGTLKFACAWPAFDIPESIVSVDSSLVIAAASRCAVIWPSEELPPGLARGGASWSGTRAYAPEQAAQEGQD